MGAIQYSCELDRLQKQNVFVPVTIDLEYKHHTPTSLTSKIGQRNVTQIEEDIRSYDRSNRYCVYTHIHIYVMCKDIIRQDHLGSLEPISYANQ